jgi:hypothetical protein
MTALTILGRSLDPNQEPPSEHDLRWAKSILRIWSEVEFFIPDDIDDQEKVEKTEIWNQKQDQIGWARLARYTQTQQTNRHSTPVGGGTLVAQVDERSHPGQSARRAKALGVNDPPKEHS